MHIISIKKFAFFAIAYTTSAALHKAIGFALFMWLARELSASEYGLFGLLFAMQTGVTALALAGTVELAIGLRQQTTNSEQEITTPWSLINGTFIWLSGSSIIISAVIYWAWLSQASQFTLWLWVVMGGVLGGYFQMQSAVWRIKERHTYAVLVGFFPPFAAFVFAFITFFTFRTLESVFLSMLSAMSLIFIWLLIKGLVPTAIKLNLSSSTSIRKNIAPYVVVAILTWAVGYGSTYLVKSLLTLEAVGAFVFIYTISSILQIVATSLNQVWSPRFFSLAQQQSIIELEVHNHRFFLIQGLCLGLVSALVLFLYHPILIFFGGNLLQYQNNLAGLAWLLAGYIASIPWWHSQNYYYLNKQGVSFMNGVMISTSAGLIFWLIAISIWSAEGVYYGFFTMMLLRSLILWFRAKQLWALRFQGMAMVMGWGLIAGAVCLIRL